MEPRLEPVAGRTIRPYPAAVFERNRQPELESCTIVTTDATESIRKIHDRMPVVLADADWDRWIDAAFSDTDTLSGLLRRSTRTRSKPGR